jgi:hypothetical protein
MQSNEYQPYNGLISLQAPTPLDNTGFNWDGYSRFMGDRFTIVDKQKQEVAFKQQPAQVDFLYHMSLYWQIIILKARKMGFSSTALGVAATKFLTGRNENCVSMSFDADASVKQLARAKHYIRSYERIKQVNIPFKYNRQNAMIFEGRDEQTGETWTNTLRVGTAKSTSFGRGDDITFLHLTEVAFCDDVPTMLSGVGEACLPNTHKVMETTANGFNSYKEFYDASKRLANDYAPLFYSPLWEYSQEYIDKKRRDLARLGAQEFPMTDMEAFLTSGEAYFDNIALKAYYDDIDARERNRASLERAYESI